MSDVDTEADALLKRWNEQQSRMAGLNNPAGLNPTGGPDPVGGTDQSPHLTETGFKPQSPDQTPIDPTNSVRPMDFTIPKSAPSNPAMTSGVAGAENTDACPQCGTMHPPVAVGTKCPMASVCAEPEKTGGLDDATVNKHLVDLRNIIMAQISSKGIKDGKKLFQHIVIELTKMMEDYNE